MDYDRVMGISSVDPQETVGLGEGNGVDVRETQDGVANNSTDEKEARDGVATNLIYPTPRSTSTKLVLVLA